MLAAASPLRVPCAHPGALHPAKACNPLGPGTCHIWQASEPSENAHLSMARAKSAADTLALLGIDACRLVTHGYGATQPIADNESDKGKGPRIGV